MTVHLFNAAGLVPTDVAGALLSLAQFTADEVSTDLGLKPVDIAICDYPGLALEELGVGGYAPGAHTAFLAIDPANPAFSQWRTIMPSMLAHELHHVRRWQGPGYGSTLLDSLVSEGSATFYEAEHFGRIPIYAEPRADLDQLWAMAQPLLDATDQHARWFFGDADLVRWAGYALGFELSRRYCTKIGISAAQLAEVPAQEFITAW